jgi:hypothetical protein
MERIAFAVSLQNQYTFTFRLDYVVVNCTVPLVGLRWTTGFVD